MPQQGVTFVDGSFLALPGAYYADNVNNAPPITPPTTPPYIFCGYGWGPTPGVPVTFSSPQNLLAALRGSPAAAFVPFIANPSPAFNGAQQITFIDTSSNTQSSLAVLNSAATDYAVLTSTLYGPPSNILQLEVSPGTVGGANGGQNWTLIDNYANTEIIGQNLSVPFQMTYTGLATAEVSYTVTSTGFIIASPVAGESVTFSTLPGAYYTIAQLVQALNGTPIAVADIISSTYGTMPASGLRYFNNLVFYAGAGTPTPVAVRSYYEPIFWVNNYASAYATAVTGAAYGPASAAFSVTGVPAYFTGAVGGAPVLSGYASALNVALGTPGWVVFCDSNLAGVPTLLAQHCETASSPPYGAWRRGFTGSSVGDSVSTTEASAQALDSLQTCYVYPGIYATNTATGINTLYGGLYAAAAAAAIAAGNQIALPLTNKVLNGTGIEQPGGSGLTNTQLIALQNAGVMALWTPPQTKTPNGAIPTILSDVTTWQADSNIENTSSQQVACRYWLAYSVVNTLYYFVGSIAAPTTESDITTALTTLLNGLVFTGNGSNGILASWQKGSLQLTYSGAQQLASVTFNATLVGQNRIITCYANIEPLNFTITAATVT